MEIEEAIKRLLVADAGVSALIGTHIYPGFLPQKLGPSDFPAIAYRQTKDMTSYDLSDEGEVVLEFEFACVTLGQPTYTQAKALYRAVKRVLSGYFGAVTDGASPESSIQLNGVFLSGYGEGYSDSLSTHRCVPKFRFHIGNP